VGKWVLITLPQEGSLTLTVNYNGCVKFEFNNIKSSYTKNYSEQRYFAEYHSIICHIILLSILYFYDIVAIKVIYFTISNTVVRIIFDENIALKILSNV